MPLIKCPDCGWNVSDKAISCPHCGYPIREMLERQAREEDSDEYDTREDFNTNSYEQGNYSSNEDYDTESDAYEYVDWDAEDY